MRRGLWVALVLAAGPVATASPSPTPAPRADTSADPWPYDHLEAFGVRALGREARAEDRKAVDRGLRWLAAHQSPDGRWEARAHARWCRGEEREVAAAPTGQPAFDVGLTALAVLALLGGGYAHEDDGPLGAAADRGVRFLQRVQDDKGFFGRLTHAAQTHAQTFATLALVEAFGMTGDPRAWSSAQKALDWAAIARNPYYAWRYGIKPGENDSACSGEMALCFAAARQVNRAAAARGLHPPLALDEEAWEGIATWFKKVTDEYGRVGYLTRGGGPGRAQGTESEFPADASESMTAMGLLASALAASSGAPAPTPEDRQKQEIQLHRKPPRWQTGAVDYYYWHFGALALTQVRSRVWTAAWSRDLSTALLAGQEPGDECLRGGSWPPVDPWGAEGGRVYSTAMAALALEAASRYPSLVDAPGVPAVPAARITPPESDPTIPAAARARLLRSLAAARAPGAASRLAAVAKDPDPGVRRAAVEGLGLVGSTSGPLWEALKAALGDPDPAVRASAARAIGRRGRAAAAAEPDLREAISDGDPVVRAAVTRALGFVGDAATVAVVEPRLEDEDPRVRAEAGLASRRILGSPEAPLRVARALATDAATLPDAVTVLAEMGPAAAVAVDVARKALGSESAGARLDAVEVLLNVSGPSVAASEPGFERAFREGFPSEPRRALFLAARLGDGAVPLFTGWGQRLLVLPPDVMPVATTVAFVGSRRHDLVEDALAFLEHVRDPRHAPALLALLASYEGRPKADVTAEYVREALERTGPPMGVVGLPPVSALVDRLSAGSPTRRRIAATLLAMHGPDAREAKAALLQAMKDPDDVLGRQAAAAFGRLGADVVPDLLAIASRPGTPAERLRAFVGLGAAGDAAASAVDVLGSALEKEGEREDAAAALARIGAPAVPALRRGLSHRDPAVRELVATRVGEMGPKSSPMVPALRVAISLERKAPVKAAMQRALDAIRAD